MTEIWEVLKLFLVIGLVAGIAIIILNYIPVIPAIFKQIWVAIILVIALILLVDQVVIPLLN